MSVASKSGGVRYVWAVAAVSGCTAALAPLHTKINSTTVALVLLLAVLFIAIIWGSGPGLLASVLAALAFNFFFLPPTWTLTIQDPQNWIALAAFLVTAVTVGQLSASARRRAQEAESGQREIERLYEELQSAFKRASYAEALRQSEKLKSALLDAVTHDIRTPLTSIKASVTSLLDELSGKTYEGKTVRFDAESRREMLEVIDEETDRLNRFIEGLIELARIEAGEMDLRRRWGAIDEIVATALARTSKQTQRHQVEVDLEKDLPVFKVDSRAVAEIVYNLVENAAKYSEEHTRIRVTGRRGDRDEVLIAVEDQGAGIPIELRERVFDKFFRATRDGDTGRTSGSGVGLAIAKGIVEAHLGRIWIEDGEGGRGTRVCFSLPIGDDDEYENPEWSPQSSAAHVAALNPRIGPVSSSRIDPK